MKKLLLPTWVFFLPLALLCFSGCQKDEMTPGFDLVFQREFTIQAGIGIFDVHHFQLKNIPSNWSNYLDQHHKTEADIAKILASKIELSGVYGDADLSVIEKISVRLYQESDPNDFVEIGYRDPTPLDSGNLLPVIPSLADAKRFLVAPRFNADVVLWLRHTTQQESEVRLDLTMRAAF